MKALHLTLSPRKGALVRVLGLAERRGFDPVHVGLEARADGDFDLSLGVVSTRPVELLVRQLNRLLEVKRAEVCS